MTKDEALEQSLEALKYEEVLAAIDDLNQLDDFMESHWIEHDLGTGRINNVLCKILKQLKWKNHDS